MDPQLTVFICPALGENFYLHGSSPTSQLLEGSSAAFEVSYSIRLILLWHRAEALARPSSLVKMVCPAPSCQAAPLIWLPCRAYCSTCVVPCAEQLFWDELLCIPYGNFSTIRHQTWMGRGIARIEESREEEKTWWMDWHSPRLPSFHVSTCLWKQWWGWGSSDRLAVAGNT